MIFKTKEEARYKIKTKNLINNDFSEQDKQVENLLLRLLNEVSSVDKIGLYWPLKNEINWLPFTYLFCEKQLQYFSLPRLVETEGIWSINFYNYEFGDDLESSCFMSDLKEPLASSSEVLPDILVVPGLAFTKAGYRLGYGKGCYDRYLAQCKEKVRTVALAFDEQLCFSWPIDSHDIAMNTIVTPTRTIFL